MTTIKHILFPYDFSKQGLQAIPFVRAAAQRFGARITAFGVVPPVWTVPAAEMPAMIEVDTEEMERDLESGLDAALTKEFAGLEFRRATASGDPAFKITEYAHCYDVDLIMMPTHGCGFFRSLLIGSVTAKVLHDSKCPVWTATHAEEQRSRSDPKTVLCAVDGTAEKSRSDAVCVQIQSTIGGRLKLLHVVPRISDWLRLDWRKRSSGAGARGGTKEHGRSGAAPPPALTSLPMRIAVGSIADTVTEEARQEGADLIIIGRGTLQSPLGRLRTHAYGIIQNSPCPVVSV